RECEPAAGQRGVPVEAERSAVDDRGQREAVALVAVRVGDRARDRALERRRLGDALDRQLALEAALADVAAGERDLGMALGIEEVGRLEVSLQVLVLHLDALDARLADELAVLQRGLEVRQLTREGGDAEVLDREADARVDRIGLPGAGRNCSLLLDDGGAHKILASAKVDDSNTFANELARASIPERAGRKGLTPSLTCALALLRDRQRALVRDRVAGLEVERVQEARVDGQRRPLALARGGAA